MPANFKNPNFRRLLQHFILAIGLSAPTATQADTLPAYWQNQRDQARTVYRKACEGDRAAMQQVQKEVDAGHPVFLNVTAWLRSNCDPYRSLSHAEVAENQLRAANLGYPIAMLGYGNRLIRRDLDDGVSHDPERGVAMLEQAIQGGAMLAASSLAHWYTKGEELPRDLAKAREYLAIAEAGGLDSEAIERGRADIAKAIAEERAKGNPVPDDLDETPQFAALAVSAGDGGFGFSHDYPTQAEAQSRALSECESRGGKDCELKLVGKGKGCMAYHYASGSSTAYGWAMGPIRDAVETRAASECSKRNGNATCSNTAWVCNDRTEAALTALLEAPMPPLTVVSENRCRVQVLARICNFDQRRYKSDLKPFDFLTATTILDKWVDFEGCGEEYARRLQFDANGSIISDSRQDGRNIPDNVASEMAPLFAAFRNYAVSEYCESDTPYVGSVVFNRTETAENYPKGPEAYFDLLREQASRPNSGRVYIDFEWP